MPLLKNNPTLRGFLIAILLSGCAAATVILPGCSAYAEMRLSLPWDALAQSEPEFVQWFNFLDKRLADVCR